MRIKTSDMSLLALRWAVAVAMDSMSFYQLKDVEWEDDQYWVLYPDGSIRHAVEDQNNSSMSRRYFYEYWKPDEDWDQGGPIMNALISEGFVFDKAEFSGGVKCWRSRGEEFICAIAPTSLLSASRCFVTLRLGSQVDVPDYILEPMR